MMMTNNMCVRVSCCVCTGPSVRLFASVDTGLRRSSSICALWFGIAFWATDHDHSVVDYDHTDKHVIYFQRNKYHYSEHH
eukprot:6271419-Pyramimonas_sp.AAC.1